MTIKTQRVIRRRRQRVLMTADGWMRAKDVIRKRLAVQTVESYPFCGGKREIGRRARQFASGALVNAPRLGRRAA